MSSVHNAISLLQAGCIPPLWLGSPNQQTGACFLDVEHQKGIDFPNPEESKMKTEQAPD